MSVLVIPVLLSANALEEACARLRIRQVRLCSTSALHRRGNALVYFEYEQSALNVMLKQSARGAFISSAFARAAREPSRLESRARVCALRRMPCHSRARYRRVRAGRADARNKRSTAPGRSRCSSRRGQSRLSSQSAGSARSSARRDRAHDRARCARPALPRVRPRAAPVPVRGQGLVEAQAGLTYAQYARHGFFELVAVSALVLPGPAVRRARRCAPTDRERAGCGRSVRRAHRARARQS